MSRQKEIPFLTKYIWEQYLFGTSIESIAAATCLDSSQAVYYHIAKMRNLYKVPRLIKQPEMKGWIKNNPLNA